MTRELFRHLVARHALGHLGFHGRDHWLRVLVNGRLLAEAEGANLAVVELFALIHDAERQSEDHDPDHGRRAAELAHRLRGRWFELGDAEMALLDAACTWHSDGLTEGDVTVRCCWDADRLDLARVGVAPRPRFLCTPTAKRPEVIAAATRRALEGA